MSAALAACDSQPPPGAPVEALAIPTNVPAAEAPVDEGAVPEGPHPACLMPSVGSELRLAWTDVSPADQTEVTLEEPSAAVRVTNDRDGPVVVRLRLSGHRGTSRAVRAELGSVELDAASSVDVPIDLDPYLSGDSPYSRSVAVFAEAEDPDSGERVATGSSPALFFHELPFGTIAVYNDNVLIDSFRGGDHDGVTPDSLDADGIVDDIREWEPPDDLDAAMEYQSSEVRANGSNRAPGSGDSLASPAEPAEGSYSYHLCIRLEVKTEDSGNTNFDDDTEDVWPDGDDEILVAAHDMKTKVDDTLYDLGQDGCVDITRETGGVWTTTVKVYSRSERPNGAYVRLHDAEPNLGGESGKPGSEYISTRTDVDLSLYITNVVDMGSYTKPRWTAIAAYMKALQRYNDDIPADTHIHVADQKGCVVGNPPCSPYCCTCGNANYDTDVGTGNSYIFMGPEGCTPTSDLRRKFVCAHEYGHAYGAQVAGTPQSPDSDTHNVSPSDCQPSQGDACCMGSDYKNYTKEWSSLAFREAWAHFVSARVWNDKAANGTFTFSGPFDLEAWDEGDPPGGYLNNRCCPVEDPEVPPYTAENCADSVEGAGTIMDWTRGLWDLHTESCNDAPSREGMVELSSALLNYGSLTNKNFFDAIAVILWAGGSDCVDEWYDIGEHNGLDG